MWRAGEGVVCVCGGGGGGGVCVCGGGGGCRETHHTQIIVFLYCSMLSYCAMPWALLSTLNTSKWVHVY